FHESALIVGRFRSVGFAHPTRVGTKRCQTVGIGTSGRSTSTDWSSATGGARLRRPLLGQRKGRSLIPNLPDGPRETSPPRSLCARSCRLLHLFGTCRMPQYALRFRLFTR